MSIAVIGGGVSGMAACYYLLQQGHCVDLFEASTDLGGRVASQQMSGRWIDLGGKNIGLKYQLFREFVENLGVNQYDYFGLNSSQLKGNQLIKIDGGKSMFRKLFNLWRLAGTQGLIKLWPLLSALRQDIDQGFLNTPYFNELAHRLDDPALHQYFGQQAAEYFLRPLTVRMNAAEPNECFLGNLGSNLRLILDSYEQLKGGMHSVVEAFSAQNNKLNITTDARVLALDSYNNEWQLKIYKDNQTLEKNYQKVVVALPASQAKQFFLPDSPLHQNLAKIRYEPLAIAVVEYDKPVFTTSHRAMVLGAEHPVSNIGAYGIEDLNWVRYTFSGQNFRQHLSADTTPEQAIGLAENLAEPFFNIRGNQRQNQVYRYFNLGLCAYSQHHAPLLNQIQKDLPKGLFLTGDYWRGASIEACFKAAQETVQTMAST
jgi:oxygen-dependent protoporphyrinogen oxidase